MENKSLSNAADDVKKQYYKRWRDNNKDKIKQYNTKYWQKKAENINSK